MADLSFAQAVDALYRMLDMPAPLRPELESGRHDLVFEQGDQPVTIRLQLAPNGRVVLVQAGDAPHFADDKSVRLDQMRQVLSTALGLSSTNRACAGLVESRELGQAPQLAINARVPLSVPLAQIGGEMKAAVEDVMELLDWQSAHLKAGAGARRGGSAFAASAGQFANEEDYVVLRP